MRNGFICGKISKETLQCSYGLKCGNNPEQGYKDLAEKIKSFDTNRNLPVNINITLIKGSFETLV